MTTFTSILLLFVGITVINCYPNNFSTRVVNGTDAEIGEFPYVISLRGSSGSHSCGGSILNSQWILTAAHCVSGQQSIQYGVNTISSTGPTVLKVIKTIVHEKYSPANTYENDIAIMKLEKPIEFNELVQPIQLPKFLQEFEHGSPAVLVGWGLEKTGGQVQKNLQKVDLMTFSDSECNRLHNGVTHKSQICCGVPEGGKGQCSGDSGGPVTVKGVQVGLVSWSIKPCASYPYPGVYTKLSHFVDWITTKLAAN